jgi:lysophospholipase L1-like esterase
VAAALMVVAWVFVPQTASLWTKGGFLLYGLGSALLVAAAALEVGPVGRLGLARPLCRLGLISYGVYLIHWPVLWLLDKETDWGPWARFAVAMVVSVALAELSMRYFEMPIRRDGRLAGKRAGALIPVAAAAALAGALVITSTAPPPVIDFAAAAERVNSTIPTPTDTSATSGVIPVGSSGPLRVATFGDSTALMTGFGLQTAAAADRRVVSVPDYAHMGCGLMIADQMKNAAGAVSPMPDDCTDWPQVWSDRVQKARPDVALVQVGPWETYDLKWAEVDGWHHLGDPVADAKARSLLQEAVDDLSATGARVAFVTASHVERRTTVGEACACPDRLDRLNELMREVAAANPERASVIDLSGWLDSVGDEDLRLRPDGVHFSEQTAAEVSRRYLLDQIVGLPPGPGRANPPGTNTG